MQVKDVVAMAVDHIRELFEHEQLSNLGLEEVEFDPDQEAWIVTVGFSRPWDYPQKTALGDLVAGKAMQPKRSFKVVRISDKGQEVLSVKNWIADPVSF